MLKGKVVVLGVCGGIAAYKSVDLVSRLRKLNAEVHVIMTRSACKFISPLTFQTLSQNYVITDLFQDPKTWEIEHISLAKKADIMVIVPATANIIGKVANGIADDMVSTTVMACKSRVVFAPAMNSNMYDNPIVQNNIEYLKSLKYEFIEPECGRLACGDVGTGKLADINYIVDGIVDSIAFNKDLKDINIMVTAGPTMEAIDPVRFISNHSSGKMGYAIARAAKYRGANVTLVSGPVAIDPVKGVKIIKVTTANEMYNAVIGLYKEMSIIIKSAAVSDFYPENVSNQKIKKKDTIDIRLNKNPDILKELGEKITHQVLVGFSMETQDLVGNAKEKLRSKNLDFIVANDLFERGAGFGVDTNIVKIITRNGEVESFPLMSKDELAHVILDKALLGYKGKHQNQDMELEDGKI